MAAFDDLKTALGLYFGAFKNAATAALDLATIINTYHGAAGGESTEATALRTTGASVDVLASAPPSMGKTLIATDATHATWQTPAAPINHAASHQHGGADEIATATPAANAIPKADATGKLDAWVTPSSGGGGRVVALLSSSHLILSGGATYALGQFYIDPAWATGMSMRFCAEARITDAAETGSLVLWDLVADEAITGSLAFTGSLDFEHDAAALTVGAGVGEIKLTARLYEIRATMSGAGLATRYMDLANAYVEVY